VGLASLFFFDGEKIAQLADAEETPLGVQEAIKSLLGVDMLDRLVDDLSQVVRRAEGRLRQGTAQGSLSEAQAILDALEKKREVAAQDMAHLHALIDRADALAQDARDQYLRHGGAVIEQLDHLHEMETSLRERLSTARGTMLALSAGALPLFAVRNLLSQVAAGSAQEQERDRARMALPVVRTINESLIRWLDEQPGEGEFKDNLSNYLASQYEQLSVVAGGGNLLGLSSFGAEQIARLLEEAEESVVRPAREALAIDDGIRQDLGQVQSHLAINANTNKADELFERIAQLNAQQVDLQAKKMLAEQKVQSIDKELTVARSALRRTVEGLVGLEEDERVIKYAQKSQATLGEFRSMVAKAKIDALSTCVEDSFRRLTRKASLVSRIDIDPEDLSIRLFDRDSCPFPKSRLSSGEKQMLAVALLWGLARASGRTLPVMIDTPMGRLDSSHRMNFVTEYLPNAGGQVIVLSTDTEIVGPYLEALSKHVGRSYRLVYSDETRATAIHEGYFEGGEQHVG
jgi:DNA sulfur modification protein DndD